MTFDYCVNQELLDIPQKACLQKCQTPGRSQPDHQFRRSVLGLQCLHLLLVKLMESETCLSSRSGL